MFLSHDLSLLFIHNQHTGGTALTNILRTHSQHHRHLGSQHANLRTIDAKLLAQYPHYFKFGFVRNPWERLLSWYLFLYQWDRKDLAAERQRFEQFLITNLNEAWEKASGYTFLLNQLDYFSNSTGEILVDRICRYEHYQTEVVEIFKRIGIKDKTVPVLNGVARQNYQVYYSVLGQELVAEKCGRDVAYVGYCF